MRSERSNKKQRKGGKEGIRCIVCMCKPRDRVLWMSVLCMHLLQMYADVFLQQ